MFLGGLKVLPLVLTEAILDENMCLLVVSISAIAKSSVIHWRFSVLTFSNGENTD